MHATWTFRSRFCKISKILCDAGPDLAQLVERLTHRYSEGTSLNPGNLTSATVCGDRTGCMPSAKRSASVAPEMDLGECRSTLHSPLQKANKAEPTLALNPRRDVTRNPKQGCQWPHKRTCVSAKIFKKRFYARLELGKFDRCRSMKKLSESSDFPHA